MKLAISLFITALLLIGSATTTHAASEQFIELEDYIVLDNIANNKSKSISVKEAFWYGCPHCNMLLPYLSNWEKTMPKNVNFELMPVPGSNSNIWTFHAKVFYALQQLNKTKQTHHAIFYAIHKQKKPANNINQIAEIVESYGVSKKKLVAAMNSFSVALKIKNARKSAAKYELSGVPALIINDKYVITPSTAKGYGRMVNILNFLVKKINKENR